jgi:hypothetical protein
MHEIHQDFFMNVSFSRDRAFHPEGDSWIYSWIRQIRRFEGVRFLPNSPTPISLSSRQIAIFHRQTTNPPYSSGQSTAPPPMPSSTVPMSDEMEAQCGHDVLYSPAVGATLAPRGASSRGKVRGGGHSGSAIHCICRIGIHMAQTAAALIHGRCFLHK